MQRTRVPYFTLEQDNDRNGDILSPQWLWFYDALVNKVMWKYIWIKKTALNARMTKKAIPHECVCLLNHFNKSYKCCSCLRFPLWWMCTEFTHFWALCPPPNVLMPFLLFSHCFFYHFSFFLRMAKEFSLHTKGLCFFLPFEFLLLDIRSVFRWSKLVSKWFFIRCRR